MRTARLACTVGDAIPADSCSLVE